MFHIKGWSYDVSFWPIRGVLLDTGNISATMVAKIVTVSIIATPEILHIYISSGNNHMSKHNKCCTKEVYLFYIHSYKREILNFYPQQLEIVVFD